jgi:hypothetical protein
MSIIRKILVALFCTAVARGIVFAFGLDQKVGALIRVAMEPQSREAVAWILSGTIGLVGLALWELRPTWLRELGPIRPDMRISDAIDYIVNDSVTKLKQPSPPRVMEYGPAKGHMMSEKGVEHEDARRLVNNELISGNLRCWGRRQMSEFLPIQFESATREIEKSYWNDMQLNYFSCMRYTETAAQTAVLPRRQESYNWSAMMVSRRQVTRIWPRKSIFRRWLDRKRPRITPL